MSLLSNIFGLILDSQTKIIYFNIAAVFLEIIVIISLINKQLFREKSDRAMLITCSILLIASISGTFAVMVDNLGPGNIVWKYIFHSGFLLFYPITAASYLWYIISLTDSLYSLKRKKILFIAFVVPAIAEALIIIINLFYPIIFHFDSNGTYTHEGNPLFIFMHLLSFLYFGYGTFYVIKYRRLFSSRWVAILLGPYLIITAAVIFETIVPTSNIELLVTTIAYLFVTFNIQSPEELTEFITKLGNDNNYENKIKRGFENGTPFYIINITITNYMHFRDILGTDKTSFLREIAHELSLINKKFNLKALVCYLHSGYFRIVVEEDNDSEIVEAVNEINTVLNTKIKYNYKHLNPTSVVVLIHCPNDINNFDSLLSFNKEINNLVYNGKVFYACDLLKFEFYNTIININKIISRAFENDSFSIHYQPIYDLKEKKYNSAEALIRCYDELFGYVAPGIFIPVLEKNGMITKIGPYVFEKVCRFMTSPMFKKLGIDSIHINLSLYEIDQENIVERITAILDNYNVSPKQIAIEITETAIADTGTRVLENINRFVELGFKISMDDFGNGYSNIRRFADYPIEIVKLDRDFINLLSAEKPFVIEDLIALFKHINCKVIAEGVESLELSNTLESFGCDAIQGFYYSKPLSEFDFVNFIQEEQKNSNEEN